MGNRICYDIYVAQKQIQLNITNLVMGGVYALKPNFVKDYLKDLKDFYDLHDCKECLYTFEGLTERTKIVLDLREIENFKDSQDKGD